MTDQSHLVIDRLVHHSEMLATITNILNGLDVCMRELLRRVAMLEEALGTDPGWPPITDVPTGDKL
jgi:hypothetical protein